MHNLAATSERPVQRLRVEIRGKVQGVGFRPAVHRLATRLGLTGWVLNGADGVQVEVEGPAEKTREFLDSVRREAPEHAVVEGLEWRLLPPAGYSAFEIRHEDGAGPKSASISPDLATCHQCLGELLDPGNRRHRYPFINCTQCGPRFSIIEALPYERAHTTMKRFAMCDSCRAEYDDPANRRFHAQPNACSRCGPQAELWDGQGSTLATRDDALVRAEQALRRGAIVAVKGLGGFHLLVDARAQVAVRSLRERKHRDEKPFAVMFPGLEVVREYCELSREEAALLLSPAAPIVLTRRGQRSLAEAVAPGNPYIGAFLPYTPLHHLLMNDLGFPVVATSGNRSDEPICIDEHEALERLAGIADLFLVHDRPIARAMEDSVAIMALGRPLRLRAGRGYAPVTVALPEAIAPTLATGAHLKSTVALGFDRQAIVSQHLGDLETAAAHAAFVQSLADLPRLYERQPITVACDLHPDYRSTRAAEPMSLPLRRVQHHEAHVWACLADNELTPPVLGVAWDGTGHGSDGAAWGGEFFHLTGEECRRVAHLRPFRLPGGDAAAREPRRCAFGLLFELLGESVSDHEHLACVNGFNRREREILSGMIRKGINAPWTTSMGRLFDAVAALLDVRQISRFEGQAAMEVQFAAETELTHEHYSLAVDKGGVIDWASMIESVIGDLGKTALAKIAAKFHNSLAELTVTVARRTGEAKVLLTGGCFQNRLLLERTVHCLRAAGFEPYWHRRLPPNDGSISLGQLVAARRSV